MIILLFYLMLSLKRSRKADAAASPACGHPQETKRNVKPDTPRAISHLDLDV